MAASIPQRILSCQAPTSSGRSSTWCLKWPIRCGAQPSRLDAARMKVTFYTRVPYAGAADRGGWPATPATFDPEVGQASMDSALEAFEAADQLGFDWVTVAEHHYAPICLTPNPLVMAGALSQRVKRARIAVLGADIPILNPVRVAEEFAMLDNLT